MPARLRRFGAARAKLIKSLKTELSEAVVRVNSLGPPDHEVSGHSRDFCELGASACGLRYQPVSSAPDCSSAISWPWR